MEMFFVLVGVLMVGILIYNLFFTEDAISKRQLKQVPRVKLGSFKEGEIGKVVGKINNFDDYMLSPLSQKPCVGYEIIVEEEEEDHDNHSSSWRTIIREKVLIDFHLETEEGLVKVKTQSSKTSINKDLRYKSGTFMNATPTLEEFLRRHGKKSTGFFGFNKTLRYSEGLLEPGETVSVLGKGTWNYSNSEVGNQDKYLEIYADHGQNLYISDKYDTLA